LEQNFLAVVEITELNNLIVVGDRVLIRPKQLSEKTQSGLYLPPGVHEKEKLQTGFIVKVGPGYPIPVPAEDDEPWKEVDEQIKYIPLQAKEGDMAIFSQRGAHEVMYKKQKYFLVPQSSILLLERDEELFS